MDPHLRIAVMHYHLQRGGVTHVIRQTLDALRDAPVQFVVVSGEDVPDGMTMDAPVIVEPALAYSADRHAAADPALAGRLTDRIRAELGGPPDVWHAHNHSLGKNLSVPRLMANLAERGEKLLLQIHDFAEDGRPANYLFLKRGLRSDRDMLYPVAPHVHYALLNHRDLQYLKQAGLPSGQLHYLPNAVPPRSLPETSVDRLPGIPDGPLWLYPTRAIRRKNIGELLLFAAAVLDYRQTFGLTLAPENPNEWPFYQQWTNFADYYRLPVKFGLGLSREYTYEELLSRSTALMTTSIAEGFGLAFLEPWTVGKPLIGRDLPDITRDFKEEDINLSSLYPRVSIPLKWISVDTFRRLMREWMSYWLEAYELPWTDAFFAEAWEHMTRRDTIDFAHLHEEAQQNFIVRAAGSPMTRSALKELLHLDRLPEERVIRHNAERIRKRYGPEAYRERLMRLYEAVACSETKKAGPGPTERILRCFTSPENFRLLRTS